MLKLQNVVKEFSEKGKVVTALDNVSLKIKAGEIVGIMGYSGAGKSTLLRLFNRLSRPESGSVIVEGEDIAHLKGQDLKKLRHKFGMIFQHFHLLWSRTVKDNVKLALEIAKYPKDKQDIRVDELLKLVGLDKKASQYPATLSGGEKQRVGIARALANNPKYLLCDEPTSALDPETTRSILELLQSLRDELQITIVIITHQMEVIQAIADRVIVMDNGKIVEENDLLPLLMNPQNTTTKNFIKSLIDIEDFVAEKYEEVFQLAYVSVLSSRPLISEIIKKYAVDVNILQGKINRTGTSSYGTLYVSIVGKKKEAAIKYLQEQGVKVVKVNDSVG